MIARFLEPAEAEVGEAVEYFDRQLEGLGSRFDADLEKTVTLLTERPEIGSPLSKRVRKFRLRTFRYNIIYARHEQEIIIIAVAHHKKRPRYWRTRMKQVP